MFLLHFLFCYSTLQWYICPCLLQYIAMIHMSLFVTVHCNDTYVLFCYSTLQWYICPCLLQYIAMIHMSLFVTVHCNDTYVLFCYSTLQWYICPFLLQYIAMIHMSFFLCIHPFIGFSCEWFSVRNYLTHLNVLSMVCVDKLLWLCRFFV